MGGQRKEREQMEEERDRVPTGRTHWSQLAEKAKHEPESKGRGVMKLVTLRVMQRNADGASWCWGGEGAEGRRLCLDIKLPQ